MAYYVNTDEGRHTKVWSAGCGGSGIKGDSIGEPDMKSGLDPESCMLSATDGDADMARKDKRSLAVTLPAEWHVGGLGLGIIAASLGTKI